MYRTTDNMSVLERTTCTKIIYDKHLHGRNLEKFGAPPMDCGCKLCGGADSQYHIIRECFTDGVEAPPDAHHVREWGVTMVEELEGRRFS